jgi:ribose transport system ATP-binding protein
MIELINVCKSYKSNILYKDVNVAIAKGEIHAVYGNNNVGKTTLLKIFAAAEQAGSGSIKVGDKTYSPEEYCSEKPIKAALLFQKLCVFDELSVKENIFLHNLPSKRLGPFKYIQWKKIYRESEKWINQFELSLNPNAKLSYLSYGQKRLVELIKVISQGADLVLLDEPAAFLTDEEKDKIFNVMLQLKKAGVTVIFVANSVDEIKRVADSVTVITKDGLAASIPVAEIDENPYIAAQGKLLNRYPKIKGRMKNDVLKLENVSTDKGLSNINLNLRNEEIIGITGPRDSGCLELLEAICGVDKITGGSMQVNGKDVEINNTHDALCNGIGYIGGNDYEQLLLGELDLKANVSLSNLKRISNKYFVSNSDEKELVDKLLEKIGIYDKSECKAKNLPVGEQKKLLMAKCIFARAKILVMDNPTSDLDVVSKVDIYNIMNELVHNNTSILLLSNDIEELKGMCDRIIVMDKLKIKRIFSREQFTLL